MTAHPQTRKVVRTKGEPYVWICSMGLAVGLLMVAGLLWLILSNGIAVFWPADVAQVTLKAAQPGAAPTTLGGEIVKKRTRLAQGDADSEDGEGIEWQFFTGNRDAYGYSFKYIDAAEIEKIEHPADAIVIERLEYGDAIGIPLGLETGGTALGAKDAGFLEKLKSLVDGAAAQRKKIRVIEKSRIGELSATMQRLQLRKSNAESRGQTSDVPRIEAELAAAQAEYEKVAAEAAQLRANAPKGTLKIRLLSGEERSIETSHIVGFYQPNEMGVLSKLKLFLHNFWVFLSDEPREANTEGGIFPAIFGTFVMTLLMSIAVMPFGIVAAIYLREYAVQGFWVRAVRIAVNNLAGVPSIVFGVFGLGFFVYLVGGSIDRLFYSDILPTPTFGTGGIIWAALTLALMTVPVIIVATEEALAAVPRGAREASLACGASKWQTIQRVVLPASASGILTGLILAMARGAGEVAPLMLVGVVKLAPSLPIDGAFPFVHLDRKFMHLGFHIYDLGFQSPDSEAAKPMVFATTLFLILLVVLLNLTAILIRERLRRKYATGAF
jgi:phosphate transport system permease protein